MGLSLKKNYIARIVTSSLGISVVRARILGCEPLTVLMVCRAAHLVTRKVGNLMFMRAKRA
jgi:hypothetical protein